MVTLNQHEDSDTAKGSSAGLVLQEVGGTCFKWYQEGEIGDDGKHDDI